MTHRPTRLALPALLALLLAACASAGVCAAGAPGIDSVRFPEVRTVRYQCDGDKPLTVRYFNSTDNQAAILRLEGKPVLAVSVVSGSGARYVGGRYEWWTKGDEGTLRDLMQTDANPPMLGGCRAVR